MKKRSALGIIISIIMSIILVPFIWAFGISGTSLITVSSVIKEERKAEIYNVFVENEGIDWIYSVVEPMIQEMSTSYAEEIPGIEVIFEGILTEEDVETIVGGFYETAVKGEIYETDLTFIADRLKVNIEKYYDENAESYVEENLEVIYDSLDESYKAEIKAQAKEIFFEEVEKEFEAQIDERVEEEVNKYIEENYAGVPEEIAEEEKEKYLAENRDTIVAEAKADVMAEAEKQFEEQADDYIRENIHELYAQIDEETKADLLAQVKEEYLTEYFVTIEESVLGVQTEVNTTIEEVYVSEEYAQLLQMQDEYAVNIYDFDLLHDTFKMAGYLCFGIAAVVILILLLCYLFRPAGFFVSGLAVLLLGAGIKVVAGQVPAIVGELVQSSVEMPHNSIGAIVNAAILWAAEGMNDAAMIGIFAGAAFVLLGILVLIIRRNKAA